MTEQVVLPTSAVAGAETSPPTEKAVPETPKPDPSAQRIAHLAKQQKALRAEQMRFKVEQEQFAKEREEVERIKSWKKRLEQKDFDALRDIGASPEELTSYLVNQPNPTDRNLAKIQAEIEELRNGQTLTQKQIEENSQRQYDQAVKQITNEAQKLVAANADKYELIAANEAHDAAVELIKKTFDTDGYMMTIEDACNEVEEYLLEESIKIMGLKKIKEKMTAQTAPASEAQFIDTPKNKKAPFTEAVSERMGGLKTITHQQLPTPSGKPLTAKNSRERAILAFQGKLNS